MPGLHRLLHLLPPETAHNAALRTLPYLRFRRIEPPPSLAVEIAGLRLAHPLGLAAGFDKNAVTYAAMLRAGFAFVEVGTATPRPQVGNPKPRLFRLAEDRAIINRLGFNNEGQDAVARRLEGRASGIVGANIGINKDSTDPVADYRLGLRRMQPLADYVTVNLSSPNTPGLRALQFRGALEPLLAGLAEEREALGKHKPLFVKVAPDLEPPEIEAIAEVALAQRIDGLIVSNTTVTRPPGLSSAQRDETGGLSGRPLFPRSTRVLAQFHEATGGRLPLIGVGGIGGPDEAWAKIRAGASALQLYTAFIYDGPALIERILDGLAAKLGTSGAASLRQVVGRDAAPIAEGRLDPEGVLT